jgi:hypothetical protein
MLEKIKKIEEAVFTNTKGNPAVYTTACDEYGRITADDCVEYFKRLGYSDIWVSGDYVYVK